MPGFRGKTDCGICRQLTVIPNSDLLNMTESESWMKEKQEKKSR